MDCMVNTIHGWVFWVVDHGFKKQHGILARVGRKEDKKEAWEDRNFNIFHGPQTQFVVSFSETWNCYSINRSSSKNKNETMSSIIKIRYKRQKFRNIRTFTQYC
jgi:hypothetical protein